MRKKFIFLLLAALLTMILNLTLKPSCALADSPFFYSVLNESNYGNSLYVYRVVISPNFATDQTVLAIIGYKSDGLSTGPHYLYRSQNGGENWQEVTIDLDGTYLDEATTLYDVGIGDDGTVYLSGVRDYLGDPFLATGTESGSYFTQIKSSTFTYDFRRIIVGSGVLLGIEGEQGILSISTDGGNSWPNTLKANLELDPNGLAVLGNNTYLAFDNNGCLWMTDDGGKTWSETSMTGGRVTSLSAAPKVYGLDKGAALAVNPACTDGLSTSRNGTTWTQIDQSQFGQYQVLSAAGTFLNGLFFVGTAQGCVLASTDWCATWTPITSGIQGNILDIEAVAINGGDIVIAGTDNGLYWMEYQLPASAPATTTSSASTS